MDGVPTAGQGQTESQNIAKEHGLHKADTDSDNDTNTSKDPSLTPNGLHLMAEGGYHGNIIDSGIAGDDCSTREEEEEEDWETMGSGSGTDTEREHGQMNGDIFSPDSADMVTVICNTEEGRREREEEQNKTGGGGGGWCDGSDTHSDSIETLEEEEESPQEGLSDSLVRQMRLTRNAREGFVDRKDGKQTVLSSESEDRSQATDDALSVDSHEIIPDVFGAVGATAATTATAPPPPRPESLFLPRPLQRFERNRSSSEPQQDQSRAQAVRAEASGGHQRTRSEAIDIHAVRLRGDLSYGDDIMSRSLPHGTLTRKGVLVEFVADDLTEKIKRSSPMSGADSSSMGSRRSSQRSLASTSSATSVATSSGMSRSPSSLLTQSPDAAPPIDPSAIMDLEMAARRVADNVDHMMGNLRSNLHKMSAITVGCSEAYKTSVDITCESVDSSIKSMYALMAKCEELGTTMTPVYQIGTQIKEIKRLLDRFEAQLSEKP